MNLLSRIKSKIKSILTTISCMTGISIVVYAIWFVVTQRNNGNNFFVNFIIGLIEAVVNSANFIIKKWMRFRGFEV